VDPPAQGQGIGAALLREGCSVLFANGCEELFATIAGDNVRSSHLFAAEGFGELSAGALFDTYGIGALFVAAHAQHVFDPGYCLWRRPPTAARARPSLQFVSTLVLHIPVVVLYLLRVLGVEHFEAVMAYRLSAVLSGLIALRLFSTWAVARLRGLRTRYRMWGSGFTFSLLVAPAFGAIMPMPGGLYPYPRATRSGPTSSRDHRRTLAAASAAGLLSTALAGVLATLIMSGNPSGLDPVAVAWLVWVRRVVVAFLVVDGILPMYPFDAYAAARIRRWSVPAWVITAALTLSAVLFIAV
ncbi:MAG: N-acetyltransferase family protein, partial [Spirochaetia bacterium]